jgi:hypothetical protein
MPSQKPDHNKGRLIRQILKPASEQRHATKPWGESKAVNARVKRERRGTAPVPRGSPDRVAHYDKQFPILPSLRETAPHRDNPCAPFKDQSAVFEGSRGPEKI